MNIGHEIFVAIKEHYPMNGAQYALDRMMRDRLQTGGYLVQGSRDLYMEVMDMTTGLVWMTAAPVQMEDFAALALEEPLVKVGIARAAMDRAAFQCSPGAPDAPVRERVIEGRLYINVATPLEQKPSEQPGGAVEITVEKAHLIGFEAGRSVAVLSLPEGDFVELVGDSSADEALVLPAGGVLKRVQFNQPWVVSLPNPTRTFFWFGENMRSFQGPVLLPESD